MNLLRKNYEVILDGPKQINWDEYNLKVSSEYNKLLEEHADSEKVFQEFFERNPCYLPGGLELFGQSGHYPYMHTLISQPDIGIVNTRRPDFLWLANDSLTFTPVFIEIEKPSKKMFNKDGNTTAEFNQALGQIKQWKYILNDANNILAFYEKFNIPLDLRKREFKPQFLLVYGRRKEYEGNELLTGIRAEQRNGNVDIMSYDRLRPLSDYKQFICCKVQNTDYKVMNIPPTFRYRADCAEELLKMQGFYEQIDNMKNTSEERKEFLKSRYQYWIEFGKLSCKGLMCSQEGE